MFTLFPASRARKYLAYFFILLFWIGFAYLIFQNFELIKEVELDLELCSIFLLAIVGLYLNSMVLRCMFYEGDVSLGATAGLKYSIYGSIATIIPFAGGMLAKFTFLKLNNVRSALGVKLVSSSAILYICSLILISGFGFFLSNGENLVLVLVVFIVFSGFFVSSFLVQGKQGFFKTKIFVLQALMIIVDSIRLFLSFKLMGLKFEFIEILIVQFSNIASLGGGAIPGGIGLKETLGALIAVKVDGLMNPEYAFIALSLNRLIGYLTLFICLFAVVIYEKRSSFR